MMGDASPVGPGGEPTQGSGAALLFLQEHDSRIMALRNELSVMPERVELQLIAARMGEMKVRLGEVARIRDDLKARQEDLDSRVDKVAERKRKIEGRLYSGEVSSPHDLQAMSAEVENLSRQTSDLEDEELGMIEELDKLSAEIDDMERAVDAMSERSEELADKIQARAVEIDAELTLVIADREKAVAQIPSQLVFAYDVIRDRSGGIGAVALVGGRCGGCHLDLPEAEIERIRKAPPGELRTCESCGRLIVP